MVWNKTQADEIEELTKNEFVDKDMALLAYNWNHQGSNYYYKITTGLLEQMAKRAIDGNMDVEKLVSKNKMTGNLEIRRVLETKDYEEYMRNGDTRGFWRKFFFNVMRNGKTKEEIRKEKEDKKAKKR